MGGLLGDRSSFIGPIGLETILPLKLKKHATDILDPVDLATTLCSTLLNLLLVITCTRCKVRIFLKLSKKI